MAVFIIFPLFLNSRWVTGLLGKRIIVILALHCERQFYATLEVDHFKLGYVSDTAVYVRKFNKK